MTDEELVEILKQHQNSSAQEIWETILSRPAEHWAGGENWDCKTENLEKFDDFLQTALSDIPMPPPRLTYVDALVSNYLLELVGAPDAENKGIRAYQQTYEKMIQAIIESAGFGVLAFAETPDTEVTPEDVEAEIRRFETATIPPRFLPKDPQ